MEWLSRGSVKSVNTLDKARIHSLDEMEQGGARFEHTTLSTTQSTQPLLVAGIFPSTIFL